MQAQGLANTGGWDKMPEEGWIMSREKLKKSRLEKGMTQQQVADYLGISLRYYQNIEAGSRTGDFAIWDMLEDLMGIHQRLLRESAETHLDRVDSQSKR